MLPLGLHIRDADIEGVTSWLWIEKDEWAWKQALVFPVLRDKLLKRCKSRRTIIQAGGCLGMYPRLWANSFERVYTFEPDPLNFLCLAVNCSNAPVIKMQAALSNSHGMCSIENGPEWNAGVSHIGPDPGHIPKLMIDDFEYESVDAIQLDCEGHELAILEGAARTIMRHSPIICVEVSDQRVPAAISGFNYRLVDCYDRPDSDPDVIFAPMG